MTHITIGETVPKLKEKAFPTNRPVQLPDPNGTPTLLLFVGYQTAPKIESVVSGLRRLVPEPEKLMIINVVDLQNVPRLMKGTAKKVIKGAYEQAAKKIPEGYDPATQLIMLTDWKGKISKAYGVDDVNTNLALVLIDGAGKVANRYQGDAPEKVSVEMILELLKREA